MTSARCRVVDASHGFTVSHPPIHRQNHGGLEPDGFQAAPQYLPGARKLMSERSYAENLPKVTRLGKERLEFGRRKLYGLPPAQAGA